MAKKNLITYFRDLVCFEVLNLSELFHLHMLTRSLQYAFAYHFNNSNMNKVLKEYTLRIKGKRVNDGALVSSIYVEDYEFQYGQVNYKDRIVLDIGADIGSTAYFFLKKGAKLIVAVEGSEQCFDKLKSNAKSFKSTIPILCFINKPEQIETLIQRWKPDILKMDIEGGEIHLFQIADATFKLVNEYLIEIHSESLLDMLKKKSAANGYEIVSLGPQSLFDVTPPYIVHIRRK